MQKYVAFISGLPLGQKAIGKDQIELALMRLGFSSINAILNSGNVAFEAHPVGVIAPLEAQISRHLRNTFELDDIWTFIRTPEQLKSIIREVPFGEPRNSIYVVLLPEELNTLSQNKLRIKRNDVDELVPAGREVYWVRRSGKGEHVPPPPISEILDSPATVRSLHALKQIVDELDHPKTAKPKLVKLDDAIRSERSRQ